MSTAVILIKKKKKKKALTQFEWKRANLRALHRRYISFTQSNLTYYQGQTVHKLCNCIPLARLYIDFLYMKVK